MATKNEAADILKEKAATATYIDEDGNKKTGTVATGAAETVTPDESGAAVDYYTKAASGYKEMLDKQVEQNSAAANASTEATLAEIARQREKTNQQYGLTDKQLYRDYRRSVRDLPQQLAALGATGGLSETSRVDLETGYGESLNLNQMQRLAELADLEAQGVAAKRQNDAAAAAQNAAAMQAYISQVIGLEGQRHQEELAKAEQGAKTLASVGDFSGYVDLGLITEEEAALMQKAWIAENPELAQKLGYVKSSRRRYYGGDVPPGDPYDNLTDVQKLWVDAAESHSQEDPDWIYNLPVSNSEQTRADIAAAIEYLETMGG